MCRSIKLLRVAEGQPTDGDLHAASLQFVRKISGYRQPSRANAPAFDAAVDEIAAVAQRMLAALPNRPTPTQEPSRARV